MLGKFAIVFLSLLHKYAWLGCNANFLELGEKLLLV